MPNYRVTQHTIQPNIALKHANAPPRRAVEEQPEISSHPAKTSHGLLRPYPTSLLYPSTMPNRGRVTQHTIQPHIASKHANATPRGAVKKQPANSQHHAKHQAYSSATLPIYCFRSPRTGVSCDPTPMPFYCACHTIVLPYIWQGQLRPYPPHRGRVTTDSEEVGSQPTPLPTTSGGQDTSRALPKKNICFP